MEDFPFTEFSPTAESLMIYVSEEGNDSNDGRSPEAPVKTLARGYNLLRDSRRDRVLLRRGDQWIMHP